VKSCFKQQGEFSSKVELDMYIRIGGYNEGVCIDFYHMPINNQDKLNNLIDDYRQAKERANELMRMLQSIYNFFAKGVIDLQVIHLNHSQQSLPTV
jgi:hypothetical protein